MSAQAYPAHWEADVLLADGKSARLRPLRPPDEAALVAFWGRLTPQSQYFRFFSPHTTITTADKDRFLGADHRRRVALGMFIGEELIAIGDFTRTAPTDAELAFVVEDKYHGYGAGGLLLEHLAQSAREVGVEMLTADVMAENRKMLASMRAAGYVTSTSLADGVLHFTFPVEPTQVSQAVVAAREHRAEANSMLRIFTAESVAVVGGSARPASVGRRLLRNVITAEFTGRVYVVNPAIRAAFGMPSYPSLLDVPDPVDLAVIAVPAEQVPTVIEHCATKDVHAVLVVSIGYADAGEEGRRRGAALVAQCRAAGIRLIGPCALGLMNVAGTRLDASLCDVRPKRGTVGFFCQSGPLSLTSLRMMVDRGIGVSSFVSAGDRGDVSGNDLLQYWEQDEQTEVILCYLESLGNSHKFSRVARRIGPHKPVIVMASGRPGRNAPFAGWLLPDTTGRPAPAPVIDAMFRQAGVIQVEDIEYLFDTGLLLAHQPLPAGNRLAVVGDTPGLTTIASDLATQSGFVTRAAWPGLARLSATSYEQMLRAAMDDDAVDAVLAVFVPAPLDTTLQIGEIRAAIAAVGSTASKTLLAVVPGVAGDPNLVTNPDGAQPDVAVPLYRSPERAVSALTKAFEYARWRDTADSPVPLLADVSPDEATILLNGILADSPEGRALTDEEVTELLAHYGIPMLPSRPAETLDAALAAAVELGGDVVLKATHARVGGPAVQRVWGQIRDANEMAVAWRQLGEAFGDPGAAAVVVQRMGRPGRRLWISATEHRSLGPVVSCRIAGVASQILQDVSYRMPPLTRADVAAMLRELRLAPLLFGGGGDDLLGGEDLSPADVPAIEDLISRIAQLTQNQTDVARLDVDVHAHESGASVAGARAQLRRPEPRYDLSARRLSAAPDGV
ncbi:MAG: GNAT family N-acetyltransferase [Dermatophilaceae bacterium]